jgi:uncharacterized protein YcnI/copper(I)-binding protein
MTRTAILAAALTLATSATPALSHVSLETAEAPAGPYKAVLSLPHGCDGEATHTVRIDLPEGFIGAKPMPKPGWTLDLETGSYAESYSLHGEDVSEGVTAVTWSGGELADAHFDEFTVKGTLAGVHPGDRLAFKTTQICANGEIVWDEVASEGENPHDLESPAPLLTISAGEGDAGHAAAGEAAAGDIVVSDFWARATLPNQKVGGGYMVITNNGAEDDRLVSMASPVSGEVEVHEMSMENDIMRMRPLEEGIAIPAGETVELAPGGLHVMFQELEGGFVEGETVPVTLTFEKAGEVTLELPVLAAGSTGGADDHGNH